MSDLVHGRHLQVESLDHESIIEIRRFTAWVGSANFGPLLTDLEKCFDDARGKDWAIVSFSALKLRSGPELVL
jgi:hypothetical protein